MIIVLSLSACLGGLGALDLMNGFSLYKKRRFIFRSSSQSINHLFQSERKFVKLFWTEILMTI